MCKKRKHMTETLFYNAKMTDFEIISWCLRSIRYNKIPSSTNKIKKKNPNTIKQGGEWTCRVQQGWKWKQAPECQLMKQELENYSWFLHNPVSEMNFCNTWPSNYKTRTAKSLYDLMRESLDHNKLTTTTVTKLILKGLEK